MISNLGSALVLVDAPIYVFRGYFSLPSSFTDAKGETNNAVVGYTRFLLDLLEKQPVHISVAWDESLNTCYRNEIYPQYKANRELPDENILYQFACCQAVTSLLGLHGLNLKHYEADDIIGTLLTRFGDDMPAAVVTRDKDLGQLLRPGDYLWDFAADEWTDGDGVEAKFGVRPGQIADYLALAGDTVDNIPGAPGIGAKTAATLLQYYGDIDAIYAGLDDLEATRLRGVKRIRNSLVDNEADVRRFREITQIKLDVPLPGTETLDDLRRGKPDAAGLAAFAEQQQLGAGLRERLANAAR